MPKLHCKTNFARLLVPFAFSDSLAFLTSNRAMFSIQITPQIAIDHLQNALKQMERSEFFLASQSIAIAIPAFPETHRPLMRSVSTCVAGLGESFDDQAYNRLRDAIEKAIEKLQHRVNQRLQLDD